MAFGKTDETVKAYIEIVTTNGQQHEDTLC